MMFFLSQRRGERKGSAGVYRSLRSLRLGEKRLPQGNYISRMMFFFSRKGAKDAKIPQGYIGLCDLSGLARKDSRKEIISLA